MNNFQQLQHNLAEEHYTPAHDERLRQGIDHSLGTFRFVGCIIDVYISRMVDAMIVIAGGEGETTTKFSAAEPPTNTPPATPEV